MAFPAQPPDLRRLSFGRESFAVIGPLALLGNASYPVSVRRLDGFATPLLSALPSRSAPCGSLRSLRPSSGRTFTSGSLFMLGTPRKRAPGTVSRGRVVIFADGCRSAADLISFSVIDCAFKPMPKGRHPECDHIHAEAATMAA